MKKVISLLLLFQLIPILSEGQTLDKFFKKYASVDQFEYTSIGKGVLSFFSLFTDYSEFTDGMMQKIYGIEILLLEKNTSNTQLFSEFQTEIDKIISIENFEVTAESRTQDDSTYMYKRVNKRSNIDLVILTTDYKGAALIWIKGKPNPGTSREKDNGEVGQQ